MQSSLFTFALFVLTALSFFAQPRATADVLTSEQLAKILEELNSIEEVVQGKRLSTHTSAVEMFRNASSSDKAAYEFYLNCVKELRYDPRNARHSEFREWRDRNEAKMKDKSVLTALRLQLQYLVLTLRAAQGVERVILVPEVEKFVAGIVANADEMKGKALQTLNEPVNRTVFAELYGLNQSLQVPDWSFKPADLGGVYSKTVFPFFRSENPDGLSPAWDRRIDLEKRLTEATQEDNVIALKRFQEERLPRLYWSKAEDVFQHVSQQQGALAMVQLLQANPDHPDVRKWLVSFRQLLTAPEEEAVRSELLPG